MEGRAPAIFLMSAIPIILAVASAAARSSKTVFQKGSYVEIISLTKPFWLRVHGPKVDDTKRVNEGTRIYLRPEQGMFERLEFLSDDTTDEITVFYDVGGGPNQLTMEHNTGNRVPPTRLRTTGTTLALDPLKEITDQDVAALGVGEWIEFDGVRNGLRRKLFSLTVYTVDKALYVMNDGRIFAVVGCTDAYAPGTWQRETDAKLKVYSPAGGVAFGVGEDFYLD